MKKVFLVIFAGILSVGGVSANITQAGSGDTHVYRDELKALKRNPTHRIAFDKEAHEGLREIERDIHNFKELDSLARFARFMFLASDALVVTRKTMPKLYTYVDEICKRHDMQTPVVFVSRHKGVFNAFAAKFFMSSGGILIGQDVLLEASDKEIEGVVAHEIGHIKHNHVNKYLFLNYAAWAVVGATIHFAAKDNKHYKKLPPHVPIISSAIIGGILSPLIIGKRFEKEADEFACKDNGKSEGLIAFFERLMKKENKVDSDFDEVYALLSERSSQLERGDSFNLYMNYYLAKGFHKINKAHRWVYHNTRWGAHPSNESRIKSAQEYMA